MSKNETALTAMEVMRSVFDEAELAYEVVGETEFIRSEFALSGVDVSVHCQGDNDSLVVVVISFPVRAPVETRHLVGEFLLRANYALSRQVWEMDFDDGEVRLRMHVDTCFGDCLKPQVFRLVLDYAILMAEIYFPFLNAVMTRAMKPEFALDQAQAAYNDRLVSDNDATGGSGDADGARGF
jgi:hypothetical protein